MSNREPRKMLPPEFESELTQALQDEDFERLLEVLETAPNWMAKQPEFQLMRATALSALDREQEAVKLLIDIERTHPHFLPIYIPLMSYYMDAKLPAHVIQSARHALKDLDLSEESINHLNTAIEDSRKPIQKLADEFGLPYETMFRAFLAEENSVIALQQDNFSQADFYARETLKIAPMWEAAYNNRAKALYYSGHAAGAIAICEEVLARDPENVFALYNLALFYVGLGQDERATEYARRFELLSRKFPLDGEEVDFAIWSLALVEDTPSLWEVAERYINVDRESLYSQSWFCLSVAAVRSDHWVEARKLINKADLDDLPPEGNQLHQALNRGKTLGKKTLEWLPPAYPVIDLLLNPKILEEWKDLTAGFREPLTPRQKHKLDQFFQKYPFILTGFKRLLWEETAHPTALAILLLVDLPDIDAEILRFALSQAGSLEDRSQALIELTMSKRYTGPEIVKLWNENLGEWHEVELFSQKIHETQPSVQPKTMALFEKVELSEDPEEQIALMRQAVELEPTNPTAVFNLGVTLIQNGVKKEGEALTYRSVEIDPNYHYGHASIALAEADRGHREKALEHLQVVNQAPAISPEVAVISNLAWAVLALNKDDLTTARYRFEIAAWFETDNPILERFQANLKLQEMFYQNAERIEQLQRRSAVHTHLRLLKTPLAADTDLRACLKINTQEMLVGTAHLLDTSPSGNKEKILSHLAEVLLDEKELGHILDDLLEDKDRAALRWLVEHEGVRPWEEFAAKFGDDLEESVYWDYHEPGSVPGRLRRAGLLFAGTLEDQQVAFLPVDLGRLLKKLL